MMGLLFRHEVCTLVVDKSSDLKNDLESFQLIESW